MNAASSAVIGLDIGTSVVKGVLIAADGHLVARAARAQALDIGPGGRVEVDARDVATNARRVISRLAGRAGAAGMHGPGGFSPRSGGAAGWGGQGRGPGGPR